MGTDILQGQWKQLRGKVKEMWGVLTNDDLDQIDGRRDRLAGKLQERYGYSRMKADEEIDRFMKDMDKTY